MDRSSSIKIVGMGESRVQAASEGKKKSKKDKADRAGSEVPYFYSGQPYSLAIAEL